MALDPSSPQVILYSKYDSDCSARLRIALQLKGIHYDYVSVDTPAYVTMNPSRTTPTLVINEPRSGEEADQRIIIWQSIAALEYLEDAYPTCRSLLPPSSDPVGRATVRCLLHIIASDIHPLTTARVSRQIQAQFPCPAAETAAATANREWDAFWIRRGFDTYERVAKETAGRYSVGDNVTLADVCLLPSVWTAERIGIRLDEFRCIKRIVGVLQLEEAVQKAHWRCQPDTPEEHRIANCAEAEA